MAANITEVLTKLILRNDVASVWEKSDMILEKGEPALEMDLENRVAKFKIGDGSHTFAELPYSTATPAEIQEMIDEAVKNIKPENPGCINSIALSPGTENGTLKLTVNNITIDNIAVTGLGSAAFTEASDYATAAQGEKADRAMSLMGTVGARGATREFLPVSCSSVGDAYKAVGEFVICPEHSYTDEEVTVAIGDLVVMMDNNKWMIIPSGNDTTAESLKQGIGAMLTGGATGYAEPVNSGEIMKIVVTEIDADYIKPGKGTIILNCGSALE
jgi:hypothetical protein